MKATAETTQRFLDIINQYKPLIYKVCYMYSDDAEYLKDLYQEVTANIWQGLGGFRAEASISTWVYRIAINTCVSYFRHHGKHSSVASFDESAYNVTDTTDEHSRQLREMYEMIGRLGKIDKAIVIMWLDGHSYDEMASITGLTRTNVATRLHRAKQRLVQGDL